MKSMRFSSLAAAVAVTFALAGAATAQTGTPGGTSGPSVSTSTGGSTAASGTPTGGGGKGAGKIARGDRNFMVKAAEDGLYEVEVAKLAAGKATSAEVKSFASMMVDDHTKSNSELTQLATAKGVELPIAPTHGKRRDLDKMNKLTGEKFDREFAQEVGIKDHKKDIKLFEKQSKDAKDPELKAFVDKTLPTLRAHLDHATKLPQNKGKG